MIPRIDMLNFTGDAAPHIGQHKCRSVAYFFNGDGTAERRVQFIPFENITEITNGPMTLRMFFSVV